jgi:hypothetical protein
MAAVVHSMAGKRTRVGIALALFLLTVEALMDLLCDHHVTPALQARVAAGL